MTVDQAVHAVKMIQPRIFYPYHYGNTEIAKLKEALSDDERIEVGIRALQ